MLTLSKALALRLRWFFLRMDRPTGVAGTTGGLEPLKVRTLDMLDLRLLVVVSTTLGRTEVVCRVRQYEYGFPIVWLQMPNLSDAFRAIENCGAGSCSR